MQRRLLLAALLSLLISPAGSAQKKSAREESGLAGPVRAVEEYEAELSREGGKIVESNRRLWSAETYDTDGRQLTSTLYKDDGGILYSDTYVYDARGRLIEKRTKHSPYTYLPDRKAYVYDARGHLTEEVGYDEKGVVLGKYVYKYDGAGNQVEWLSAAEGKNLVYRDHKTIYTYDGEGRASTSAGLKPEGSTYVPDDSGMGYQKEIYLYDSAGRRAVTTQLKEDGSLFRVSVSEYDARGNEVATATYNADGSLREKSRYEYEFDSRGNWVKQVTSEWVTEDGKSFFSPKEVSYRTIKYFKPGPKARPAPAAAQTAGALQNTDAEDYAVYAAILNKYFEGERVRLLVIKKFTEGFRTNDPEERRQLSPDDVSLRGVERATLDDYVEKNKGKQYELLDKLLALKDHHALVSDSELSAIFAKDCGKGWDTFYQRYPNSQGVTTLSKVGFNKDRTQALVYAGTQSHCLAGGGHFIILAKEDGVWVVKRSSMLWIS